MNQLLRVALAVIIDPAGSHILIARRLEDAHLGGYWEFPGGKIETNESAAECAMREALEEVGLDVVVLAPMTPVSFDYKDRRISLEPFFCQATSIGAVAQASQEVRWASMSELGDYSFPAANASIIAELNHLICSRAN